MMDSIHQYLDLPSPAMKPFIEKQHYIGRRNKCQEVDESREAVARAQIRGGDFLGAHNQIEDLLKGIFERAGFIVSPQPSHIFHGKIP